MIKPNRVGEIKINKWGTKMWIKEYFETRNITVEFENGFISHNRQYHEFKNGAIISPKCKTVFNIGYLDGENAKDNFKAYKSWSHMFERIYSQYHQIKRSNYKDCFICKEWHSFKNFNKWYEKNYYEIENEIMCLDKDILIKGNKIYSKETCIFVPNVINALFTNRKNYRGNYPIGVRKKGNKYEARGSFGNNKVEYLGTYKTIEEAFIVYKKYKESYIKKVAEKYKNKIPKKLYNAMINYKIEIND